MRGGAEALSPGRGRGLGVYPKVCSQMARHASEDASSCKGSEKWLGVKS